MTNLKNYYSAFKHFVIYLTLLSVIGCSSTGFHVKRIEGSKTNINSNISETAAIEAYIKPYRMRVDAEMNAVLSVANQNFDKSGEWQTPMGNLLADAVMQEAAPLFLKRNNKSLDICLLNHGGIRANISRGNVTTRTAFEVMPFENSLIVVALKGDVLIEMLQFIIAEKKPHPLAGITFAVGKDGNPKKIFIQGKPIDLDATYNVGTSDYLSGGGDKMDFFKKRSAFFDMDYKLRNILIDYFKKTPILPMVSNIRISVEQ